MRLSDEQTRAGKLPVFGPEPSVSYTIRFAITCFGNANELLHDSEIASKSRKEATLALEKLEAAAAAAAAAAGTQGTCAASDAGCRGTKYMTGEEYVANMWSYLPHPV